MLYLSLNMSFWKTGQLNTKAISRFLVKRNGILGLLMISSAVTILGAFSFLFSISIIEPSADAANSTNFETQADIINCGDEISASSTSFSHVGSVCDFAPGNMSSASFTTSSGFPVAATSTVPFITFSLNKNTVSFGTLSTTSTATDSVVATVETNADYGYTASVVTDGDLRRAAGDTIDIVTDGAVTTGSEEYGISTSGSDGQYNSTDTGISTISKIYALNSFAANSATTLTFRAAISDLTAAGRYSQKVYLTAVGSF